MADLSFDDLIPAAAPAAASPGGYAPGVKISSDGRTATWIGADGVPEIGTVANAPRIGKPQDGNTTAPSAAVAAPSPSLTFDDLIPTKIDAAATSLPTSADMHALAQPPRDAAGDAVGGLETGLKQAPSGVLGMLGDAAQFGANAGIGLVKMGAKALGVPDDRLEGGAPQVTAFPTSHEVDNLRQDATGTTDYQPQTPVGHFAEAVGRNLPNAFLPGSLAMRAVNVLAPVAGGQTGRAVVKAAGGGEGAQSVGETVGSLVGGVAGNVRVGAAPDAFAVPKLPSIDELRAQKNAAYNAVDNAGIQYSPDAVNGLVADIKAKTQAAMVDPDLHPQATAILKRVNQLQDQPLTLSKLDQIRRLARDNVIASASKDQRRIGYVIQDAIDGFIGNAGPNDLIGGADPQTAAATLSRARDLNTRVAKMEGVARAVDSAKLQAARTGSGGNVENAMRQKLSTVLQKSRGLTDDEQNALTTTVVGTPVQNVLRRVGKLSPEGNGLMLAGHLGAGIISHGTSLPIAVTGAAAKAVAEGMSRANVQQVLDLMATGGDAGALRLAQMSARDARIGNLVRQLSRVSMNSSTANALSGASRPQVAPAFGSAQPGQ